jgi:hypothetical protein
MSDTERDDLRSAIGGVLVNASNFPPKVQFRMLGQDMSPLIERVVDALHAAGYRKPVAVEGDAGKLIEELDSGCNDGGDLPSLLSRAARAIESQQQRIRELEAELKAAYASETYEQRRAEQAEATIARVREWSREYVGQ